MGAELESGALVGEKLGKYELLALLAVGGTAEIYLARIGGEAGFEKYVVVKCLHDHLVHEQEFVDMFLDEARLGAQLDHSNIVQTLELGEHQGRYYMVMEYLAGLSVAQIARVAHDRLPGGLIPPDMVLGLAAQACTGLHYAHERTSGGQPLNIVHRDISPQNLVVSFDGVLKLVDFGIAKAERRRTHTETGTIKGKFAYMSPEQCKAEAIDRRTDIFALGTIIHELLTGRRLFKRESTYDTYLAIVRGEVPRPSAVNKRLDGDIDDIVLGALAYHPGDRYASAETFGEALLGLVHKRGGSASASDVAEFFDRHFSAEIDEHAAQMREIISGKRQHAPTGVWQSADPGSGSDSQPAADPNAAGGPGSGAAQPAAGPGPGAAQPAAGQAQTGGAAPGSSPPAAKPPAPEKPAESAPSSSGPPARPGTGSETRSATPAGQQARGRVPTPAAVSGRSAPLSAPPPGREPPSAPASSSPRTPSPSPSPSPSPNLRDMARQPGDDFEEGGETQIELDPMSGFDDLAGGGTTEERRRAPPETPQVGDEKSPAPSDAAAEKRTMLFGAGAGAAPEAHDAPSGAASAGRAEDAATPGSAERQGDRRSPPIPADPRGGASGPGHGAPEAPAANGPSGPAAAHVGAAGRVEGVGGNARALTASASEEQKRGVGLIATVVAFAISLGVGFGATLLANQILG